MKSYELNARKLGSGFCGEIFGDGCELFQGCFQIGGDIGSDDLGGGEIGGVFEGFVLEPENIEVRLVPLGQLLIGEGLEALALLAVVAVLRIVGGDEVIEVAPFEGILFEGEMLVRPQIIDPELLGPRLFLCGLTVEEKDIRLHSLGVEDPGGESQQRMDIGLLEKFPADRLPCPTLEEDIIGEHHGGAAMLFENCEDVLEEVELLVARAGPEVVAVDREGILRLLTVCTDDRNATFLPKGRVGQHHVVFPMLPCQRVLGRDREIRRIGITPDAVQEEIHGTEPGDAIDQLESVERAIPQALLLRPIKCMVMGEKIMGRQQEATRTAGRIADRLAGLGGHGIDDGCDQGAGGEVLASSPLHIGGVLFQESLVGIPLDIDTETRPLLLVDEIDNQSAKLGRVLNFVLRLTENQPQHSRTLAQLLQGVPVVGFQIIPIELDQDIPAEALWDR